MIALRLVTTDFNAFFYHNNKIQQKKMNAKYKEGQDFLTDWCNDTKNDIYENQLKEYG